MSEPQGYHPLEDMSPEELSGASRGIEEALLNDTLEDVSLEELTEALRGIEVGEVPEDLKPRLTDEVAIRVIPEKGVIGMDLLLEEAKGKLKLSEATKRSMAAREYRAREAEKQRLREVKKRKKRLRQKKHQAAKMKRLKPIVSKEYRMAKYGDDPRASYEMAKKMHELNFDDWELSYEDWRDHIWPVLSKNYVYIRRWSSDRPMTLDNVWLQDRLNCKSEGEGPGVPRRKPRPQGVLFDGMELKMKELGMMVD